MSDAHALSRLPSGSFLINNPASDFTSCRYASWCGDRERAGGRDRELGRSTSRERRRRKWVEREAAAKEGSSAAASSRPSHGMEQALRRLEEQNLHITQVELQCLGESGDVMYAFQMEAKGMPTPAPAPAAAAQLLCMEAKGAPKFFEPAPAAGAAAPGDSARQASSPAKLVQASGAEGARVWQTPQLGCDDVSMIPHALGQQDTEHVAMATSLRNGLPGEGSFLRPSSPALSSSSCSSSPGSKESLRLLCHGAPPAHVVLHGSAFENVACLESVGASPSSTDSGTPATTHDTGTAWARPSQEAPAADPNVQEYFAALESLGISPTEAVSAARSDRHLEEEVGWACRDGILKADADSHVTGSCYASPACLRPTSASGNLGSGASSCYASPAHSLELLGGSLTEHSAFYAGSCASSCYSSPVHHLPAFGSPEQGMGQGDAAGWSSSASCSPADSPVSSSAHTAATLSRSAMWLRGKSGPLLNRGAPHGLGQKKNMGGGARRHGVWLPAGSEGDEVGSLRRKPRCSRLAVATSHFPSKMLPGSSREASSGCDGALSTSASEASSRNATPARFTPEKSPDDLSGSGQLGRRRMPKYGVRREQDSFYVPPVIARDALDLEAFNQGAHCGSDWDSQDPSADGDGTAFAAMTPSRYDLMMKSRHAPSSAWAKDDSLAAWSARKPDAPLTISVLVNSSDAGVQLHGVPKEAEAPERSKKALAPDRVASRKFLEAKNGASLFQRLGDKVWRRRGSQSAGRSAADRERSLGTASAEGSVKKQHPMPFFQEAAPYPLKETKVGGAAAGAPQESGSQASSATHLSGSATSKRTLSRKKRQEQVRTQLKLRLAAVDDDDSD